MEKIMYIPIRTTLISATALLLSTPAFGHFPWLMIDEQNKAVYYFGETIAQRDYKLPDKIVGAFVHAVDEQGTPSELPMSKVEEDGFIGKKSDDSVGRKTKLYSAVTYGIHGGSRLDYYTQHIGGRLPKSFDEYGSSFNALSLRAMVIDTDSGVKVRVLRDGKPLTDEEVILYCDDGHEEGSTKTDNAGEVEFSDKQVEAGLNALRVGTTEEASGSWNEREYTKASHYLTVTFFDPETASDKLGSLSRDDLKPIANGPANSENQTNPSIAPSEKPYADLPLSLTSFGAARVAGRIYVYGGHTGEAHHYSTEEQSNQLLVLDTDRPKSEWKSLSAGRRLQGLGMVAYKNRIIRIGGFEAMNKLDDDHDLCSTDEVMSYDTIDGKWTPLPSLPEPRSSHDATLLGSRIFVVGGWTIRGEETTWLSTAWSLDLENLAAGWKPESTPSFQRRALALATLGERVYAVGGMDEKGGPTTAVSYLDTAHGTWHEVAKLPGKPMNGFGAAVVSIDGVLIATTSEGDILRLTPSSIEWESLGKSRDHRFFHRLLPLSAKQFIAIGGADMARGKFPNVEVLNLP